MSKNNKTYQVKAKRSENQLSKLTLVGGHVSLKIDNIHKHLQEINRGYGVVKSKKTYNRNKNHQNTYSSDDSFYFTYYRPILFTI